MSKEWYDEYKNTKESPVFQTWWVEYYGLPIDYNDSEQDEYWIRKGFALDGWTEAGKQIMEIIKQG